MVTRRADNGHDRLELAGELDLASADELRAELSGASNGNGAATIVDLKRLKFIDSTGLGVLFEAFERAHAAGRRLIFTPSSPEVTKVLRLTGLDRILPFEDQPRSDP